MMDNKLKLRVISSKGGAFVAFTIYVGTLTVLGILGLNSTDWPKWFTTLIVPANLFINSPSKTLILGVSSNLILASLAMYMALGYLIDWFHDPYK